MSENIKAKIAGIFTDMADAIETGTFGKGPRVGLTLLGSEHGPRELLNAAKLAHAKYPEIQIVLIGSGVDTSEFEIAEANSLEECHAVMERLLDEKQIDGCVTLHYSFPFGVSTVGRVITPGRGREMILATTTGSSDTDRIAAMVKNCLYGVATAKALGMEAPTVGILNLDGANAVGRHLKKLAENGYPLTFAESAREDGGITMRGNDLLLGTPDIMVNDTLTGNLLMKLFSAFNSGGDYETLGYGYGPGVGEGYERIISIISRASGAPVIADALKFTADVIKGDLLGKVAGEMKKAQQAGLQDILASISAAQAQPAEKQEEVQAPPSKIVEKEIGGIDILEIEDARLRLWKAEIYAETGMGCTGPVILVAKDDLAQTKVILTEAGYIG